MKEEREILPSFDFKFPEISGTDIYDVEMTNKSTGKMSIIPMRIHSEEDINRMRNRLMEIRQEAIDEEEARKKTGKEKIRSLIGKAASIVSHLIP